MAQEEQNQRGSTGSSGVGGGNIAGVSKSSKKQKQKKIPQRGLGVAQLERIRIEELKKKDGAAAAAAMAATAILSPHPPIPQATVPLANPGKSEVLEMGRGTGTITMHENTQKMWSSAGLRPKSESSAVDPAFAICPNWNPPCETDHVWPLPGPIPRFQLEYHNQMNVIVPSTPTSSSQSSTLLNLQMEPPSNQNYSYTQVMPKVEKVVGVRRTCPFSLKEPPPISQKTTHHTDQLDESASHGGGSMFRHNIETGNLRNEHWDGLSFSRSSSTPDSNLTRGLKDNGIFGEVLTLAPPSTSTAWMNPKSVEPPPTLPSDNKDNFLDHKPVRLYQGHLEELGSFQQGLRNVGQQHRYYYSFLPPAIPQDPQAESDSRSGNGEDRECIDLELRL